MTWEEREKKADIRVEVMNGPDWALSVLHGVVSSVLSSSVVLCWSQCDWLQLGSRCDSSTGSVGSPSASVGSVFFLKYVVLKAMDSPEKEKRKKNSTGWTKALTTLMLLGCKVPVCVICCIGRCLSGWMLCLLWVSVFIWCWCELWPAVMCQLPFFFFLLPQNGWAGGEGGRPGTKCSSVPRTRHPRKCALSSWLLCWDAGVRNGWYQSYTSSC